MRMPRCRCYPLSEGIVRLTRPHQGPGVKVHAAGERGGFVTLTVARCANLEDATAYDEAADEEALFRVACGDRADAILVRTGGAPPTPLVANLWLEPWEEVWVSTNRPGKHLVFGFSSASPVV